MVYLMIRHQIEDFARWKPVFDEHGATRKKSGSRGGRLYRGKDNPNDILIVLDWDTQERARGFVNSPDLRETMARAGVKGQPQVAFLDEVEKVAH